jgi:prepilin-type N-terminal cleavage/methylation domain-containing protein
VKRARRQGGFSLIEMMIALGILAFGILATMAGQVAAMHFSSNSREHTMAMKLAEDQMEEFFVMTAADVKAEGTGTDPGNPIDPDPGDGNAMAFSRSWIIDEDTPEAGIITITVQVSWVNENGNTQTARIQSFKADL